METKATCPYCGVGCGVLIEHDGARITGVRGDPEHPANFGRLCTKGSTLHFTARHETRLLHPELRGTKGEARRRVGWDEALGTAAQRFADVIKEHGPDAVAFYISGQLLTEDYYVFNKLMKGLIGSNNVDTNSRLCMSSAVAAYKQTLGADAPPCSYEDFAETDCLLIAGGNPSYAHPIAFRRIEDAKAARPDMKIIVVDPRRTDTAATADLHLPILPGTDIWLFNAMLNVLLWEGHVDTAFVREHTEGFDALREHVREITPAVAAEVCGLGPKGADDIRTAARWWGESPRAMSLWCQGLNQSTHGTHNGAALIALSLATGKIGKPGCGPFSMTGQPNAMGGREVGGLANLLSAHRDLANPAHRAEVARLWGVADVPEKPGLTAVELFDAMHEGRIKALWIACTNPAQSLPELERVREALVRCDFVVLQEAYGNTETAPFADLLLPAASWGEKEGTVTNSERRITHVNRAIPAPGETRADWAIVCDFARKLGPLIGKPEAERMFGYAGPEAIFVEHAESTRGRDLDITGLSYALLDTQGPQQWPFPAGATQGRARLYTDGRFPTADGRARFVVPTAKLTAERADARFPLRLTTGRLRDQWHGMSRTGKVARLYNHVDEARIELNADDMHLRGIADGELVRVKSRRGEIVLRAAASGEIRSGQAFVAMHWGANALNSGGINVLTLREFDPYSKQPELKHATVQIEKANLPHQALIMRGEGDTKRGGATAEEGEERDPAGVTLERAALLAPWLERFAYASLALAGRDHPAVVLRIAHDQPIPQAWLDELDALLGLDDDHCLAYSDARRGITKRARIEDGLLVGLRLTGETAAAGWLRDVLVERQPTAELRRWILAPLSSPPAAAKSRGRIVCNCLNVSESDIAAAIGGGAGFADLQEKLKCGTSCGSCVPEIKRLVAAGRRAA
ncbi:molybdopterin-dependent oxidoreductase [Aromatoleum toluolicum]|uniref:Molybdopterin-dependent oxidoreductase n=1 Tax=Aromatoleum toluolicum TaxID=90060 RepID=A0ABX1NDS5_9RHOO|nr:nitrate reductase [Aromatoleum toluolicum]NMF97427.1 molybdopterin-dependent oxidoreductase [Aromatoleum toluolicum]